MLQICCFRRQYSHSFQNYYSNQTKYTPQGVLYGGPGFETRGETEEFSLKSCTKFWASASFWMSLPTNKLSPPLFFHGSPHPFLDCGPHIGKKWSLIVFRQISQNILYVVHIFNFIITDYLKTFSGIKSLSKKQCPAELSLWIIPPVYPILLKNFPFLSSHLLPPPCMDCFALLPTFGGNPAYWAEFLPAAKDMLISLTRKSSSQNSNFHVIIQ